MTKKTYTIEEIRIKLRTDQKWTERAILKLYERQTADEQQIERTKWMNGVGFNATDSRRLSRYAEWLNSGKKLSGEHVQIAQRMVAKYAGQILEMIEYKQSVLKMAEEVSNA